MLSASSTCHQFRPQNSIESELKCFSSSESDDFKDLNCNSVFLPSNSYPVQSPGFTAHWNKNEVRIIKRIGDTAKVIESLNTSKIYSNFALKELIFDLMPRHERIRNKNRGTGGIFGWLRETLKWDWGKSNFNFKDSKIEIAYVIPLMCELTIFDALIVFKKEFKIVARNSSKRIIYRYGFSRIKEYITEMNCQEIFSYASIPALEGSTDQIKFIHWKSYLIAVDVNIASNNNNNNQINPNSKLRFINLMDSEPQWTDLDFKGINFDSNNSVVICESKDPSNDCSVLLFLNGINIQLYVLKLLKDNNDIKSTGLKGNLLKTQIAKNISSNELSGSAVELPVCGFIEDGNVFVVCGPIVHKISIENDTFISEDRWINEKFRGNEELYLFPWRQDLKVSGILFLIEQMTQTNSNNKNENVVRLSVYALDDKITENENFKIESKLLVVNEDFKSETQIISVFATSSLELFLVDSNGHVTIFEGLLLRTEWNWFDQKVFKDNFEFSRWFNILGEFPFNDAKFYDKRREDINSSLFIDEILIELSESCDQKLAMIKSFCFPPKDWKCFSRFCSKLKEIDMKSKFVLSSVYGYLIYYLMASGTSESKLHSFFYHFGMTDREVALIELFYYADHGKAEEAVKVFCTRKLDESCRLKLVHKFVRMIRLDKFELNKFTLYAAGRLIPLDILVDDGETFYLMIESILRTKKESKMAIICALDWIKGLFAWLRPDDRCALIPVALLHQELVKKMLVVLLELPLNSDFKDLGHELISVLFETEMLRCILDKLEEELEKTTINGDRAAWLITMICASRSRWHEYFLNFNFSVKVRDSDVLKGIELIKGIVRGLTVAVDEDEDETGEDVYKLINYNEKDMMNMSKNSPITSKISIPSAAQVQHENYPNSPSFGVVYARTPSSPQFASPHSPSAFIPRHFPTKKPTTLSTTSHLQQTNRMVSAEIEEDDDPFRDDLLMRNNGKRVRSVNELLNECKSEFNNEDNRRLNGNVVMLAKSEELFKEAPVFKLQSSLSNRSSKRRKHN